MTTIILSTERFDIKNEDLNLKPDSAEKVLDLDQAIAPGTRLDTVQIRNSAEKVQYPASLI